MIIWTTGIIEAEVNPVFFQTRKYFQSYLDEICSDIKAGDTVKKIRVVFVVNRDAISEFQRFSKKEQILDIRVRVPYEEFRDSSLSGRVVMFMRGLTASIDKVKVFKKAEFDKAELIRAIEAIPVSSL